jgi:hypothetical protein
MFFNETNLKKMESEEFYPGHYLIDFSKGLNHTAMFLIFLPLLLFFRSWLKLLKKMALCMKLWKPIKGITIDWDLKVKVDEFLGSYWDNMSGSTQMRCYAHELHNQHHLGIKTLDENALEKLRTSKRKKKIMQSIVNYDLL